MDNLSANNNKKKSLTERFLFVLGFLFFVLYFCFGLAVIFWKKLPLDMPQNYRILFGVIIIVYAFLRFIRFFKK
jgi:cytochrome c biogenesis protein CcdA